MIPSNIYLALRQHFSPLQIKNLVPALRQEPLVWEYVTTQFAAILENQDFANPSDWIPARLGQHALGLENRDEAQLAAVHQKSVDIVKNLPKPVTTLSTLDQASAIAFSLVKIGKPAKKIGLSITHAFSNENYALDSSGWKSVLACLPIELLTPEALPFDQILHAVLCQPVDEEALADIIKSHFLHADIATQIKVIQFLAQSGRTNLSRLVANQFVNDFPIEEAGTVDSIDTIRQQALLYQAAGNLEKADELLGVCEKKLTLTQTDIINQQEILKEDNAKRFFDNGEDGISADLATVNLYLEQGNIAESKKLAQSISAKMIDRVANRKSVISAPNYVLDVNPYAINQPITRSGIGPGCFTDCISFPERQTN